MRFVESFMGNDWLYTVDNTFIFAYNINAKPKSLLNCKASHLNIITRGYNLGRIMPIIVFTKIPLVIDVNGFSD